MEQTLLNSQGLPGRPWYQHLIYAPGRFTGYGAKTLPGVREAIEEERWADADKYSALTAQSLEAFAARLDQATALIRGR
jgi:N-acetylated-alpha-linked acidic dipeptidase